MASFWDGISKLFGRFVGVEDSEDEYTSPSRDGKRKAIEELPPPFRAWKSPRHASVRGSERPSRESLGGTAVTGEYGSSSRLDFEDALFTTKRAVRPSSTKRVSFDTTKLKKKNKLVWSDSEEQSDADWGRKYWSPMPKLSKPDLGPSKTPRVPVHKDKSLSEATAKPGPSTSRSIKTPAAKPIRKVPRNKSDPRPLLKEWTDNPSEQVQRIISKSTGLSAVDQIVEETQEPEYTIRDAEMRDMIWQIMDLTERLANAFFGDELTSTEAEISNDLLETFSLMDESTSLIIGCIASGGPHGADGWHDLFIHPRKRRALVCGIIGNVLVEQVFKHPMFGADPRTIERLNQAQVDLQDDDGFARKHHCATMAQTALFPKNDQVTMRLPSGFQGHTDTIVAALYTHLMPIFTLPESRRELRNAFRSDKAAIPSSDAQRKLLQKHEVLSKDLPVGRTTTGKTTPGLIERLTTIVATAGFVSLQMALDPHTVYYHTPVFKEDRFEYKRHEAFNKKQMEQTHPRQPDTVWPEGTTDAEKKRARGDEALNQILLMDGLTTYRKGGWETPRSVTHFHRERKVWQGREYSDEKFRDNGFRARVLTHGWVFCRWGRARPFGSASLESKVAQHGASYKGFIEFRQVEGVPTPLGTPKPVASKTAKKGEGSGAAKGKGKMPMTDKTARYK